MQQDKDRNDRKKASDEGPTDPDQILGDAGHGATTGAGPNYGQGSSQLEGDSRKQGSETNKDRGKDTERGLNEA